MAKYENRHYRKLAIALAEVNMVSAQLDVMWAKYMNDPEMPGFVMDQLFSLKRDVKRVADIISDEYDNGTDVYNDIAEEVE